MRVQANKMYKARNGGTVFITGEAKNSRKDFKIFNAKDSGIWYTEDGMASTIGRGYDLVVEIK